MRGTPPFSPTFTNLDPINDREQWALTGAITLKSLTSYRKFDAIFFHDFDMSSYPGLFLPR